MRVIRRTVLLAAIAFCFLLPDGDGRRGNGVSRCKPARR